jgi:hypothetical protein
MRLGAGLKNGAELPRGLGRQFTSGGMLKTRRWTPVEESLEQTQAR